jgi:N-carbamoylputrescine amidase
MGTRPVLDKGTPHNDAFVWQPQAGASFAHRKYYLPNEPGFWEATWYRRAATPSFQAVQAGDVKVGFMICSDLWFGEHARGYARQGIHILANPRATERASVDKWIAAGRTLAVMAGAYCLSSNHAGETIGVAFGGTGWVIDPNGLLLATTSDQQPFVTVEIDPALAEAAKTIYPRDVKE